MSGEYYILEEITEPEKPDEPVNDVPFSISVQTAAKSSRTQNSKLKDIEVQLEMAERRCSTLKSQLDYMKQLYGVKKNDIKSKVVSAQRDFPRIVKHNKSSIKSARDNKSDASSVGKLDRSQLLTNRTFHTQLDLPRDICGYQTHENDVDDCSTVIKVKSEVKTVTTSITKFATHPESKGDGSVRKNFRNLKTNIKKMMSPKSQNTAVAVKSSRKQLKKPSTNSTRVVKRRSTLTGKSANKVSELSSHKLVEIYHNAAVKASDSDDSNEVQKRTKQKPQTTSTHLPTNRTDAAVPQLNLCEPVKSEDQLAKQQVPQNKECCYQDFCYDGRSLPQTEYTMYSKNYELPTIASRMKQVAKNYLNTYNFKAIPFCAAISTSPSHNIGINIQQVMNIMKTRQPMQGLSPTLAHNIMLAANRINCKPLSAFISTVTSKLGCGKSSTCPLMLQHPMNLPQLEEAAKVVTDDTINEEDEEAAENEMTNDTQTHIITGPSGDVKIENQKKFMWSVDRNSAAFNNTCTCIPEQGYQLHQVAHKYQANTISKFHSSNALVNSQMNGSRSAMQNKLCSKSVVNKVHNIRPHTKVNDAPSNAASVALADISPLQGKERNLKEVLTNLHNEFAALNKKYEELCNKASSNNAEADVTDKLQQLEKELNNKEEEITMVMTLYKEVLALKQQVKSLTKTATRTELMSRDSKLNEYSDPKAVFHLTKLLKQIQHYQVHYKKSQKTNFL